MRLVVNVCLLVMASALAGCGQSGPLYLPDRAADSAKTAQPSADADAADKESEKDSSKSKRDQAATSSTP